MENAERIEENLMPQKTADGKDEMNLAEFPLCALSRRLRPDQKTLRFADRLFDKGRREWITRQLTITGSDAFGLPTALDDEVLLGLIQLTRQRDFADRKVPFTRHELIRMLGWRDDSKSYARVEASLNRWTGVTLYYNKAWWNKERKCWMDEKFHVLDNVWLCHRGEPAPDTGLPLTGAPQSAFVWNEVIFRSFTNGNLKSIDFEFFKSLKSAVTRRLYRFLDKRFWHDDRREFDMRELCCEHIGLSRHYDTANLKRKLLQGIAELEKRGFIRALPMDQRFTKVRRGEWSVVFESAEKNSRAEHSGETARANPMIGKLMERGVTAKTAENIANEFPAGRIETHIQVFDRLKQTRDAKVSRNPAGYLVSSIKHDYAPPMGFTQTADGKASGVKGSSCKNRNSQCEKVVAVAADPNVEAVEAFWASLSGEAKLAAEAQAMSEARALEKNLFEQGGVFAAAARQNILDAYALKQLRRNQ